MVIRLVFGGRSMKVDIIGAGNWGRNLIRVFCTLLGQKNVTVCDTDVVKLEEIRRLFPGIRTVTTPTWEGDAAVIATPPETHYSLAVEAIEAGKDVLVEKPMTTSLADAQELVSCADRLRRILMVDHLLEYHPAVVELARMVREGRFGRILYVHSQRLNAGVRRTDCNALWSLAPHDVSIICYLVPCDAELKVVSAVGEVHGQHEATSAFLLRHSSGPSSLIHVSWLYPIKTRRLVLVGEEGSAVFDDLAGDKLVVYDGPPYQRGIPSAPILDAIEPLVAVAEAFIESVETRKPPRTDGRDGMRVVSVLERVQAVMEKRRKHDPDG